MSVVLVSMRWLVSSMRLVVASVLCVVDKMIDETILSSTSTSFSRRSIYDFTSSSLPGKAVCLKVSGQSQIESQMRDSSP